MDLITTHPGVKRWTCTAWCGREAAQDERCCAELMPAYEAAARELWPAFTSLSPAARTPMVDAAKAAVDAALAELGL